MKTAMRYRRWFAALSAIVCMGLAGAAAWDDHEQQLIEMRRRALEAEAGLADIDPSIVPISISIDELDALTVLPGEIGPLPGPPAHPVDNAPTPARVELGRRLFFDRRLSRDSSMSCATCHDPAKGWADGRRFANGFERRELGRHTPTILNAAYNTQQFWDSRASTLEAQALGPIFAPSEMNMPTPEALLQMLSEDSEYVSAFSSAYGQVPSVDLVASAIASFERTIVTSPTRFDRYMSGDKSALDEQEKRGLILFATTASCTACHKGPNFTDNKSHAIGLRPAKPEAEDLGRYALTQDAKDMRAFKTPGLRNIEQTAPYMHDGSLATLDDVVEFYNKGGEHSENRSDLIKPLNLTADQKRDLVCFLRALSGPVPQVEVPIGIHFGK